MLDFDLLVLDVMMPGEDGFALTRWLRGRPGETGRTPVLILTARGLPDDRIEGLALGADDYLAKPFEPQELVLRIEAILRRAGAARRRRRAHAARPLQLRPARGELCAGRRAGAADRGARRSCCASWPPPPTPPSTASTWPARPPRPPAARWTSRSPACAARSRTTRRTRATCRPCAASATCWRRTDAALTHLRIPSLLRAALKRRAPTSLFGRSLLIIVLPMALMQIAVTWVFFDAHWQTVNSHLTEGLAGDVAWILQAYEDDPTPAGLKRLDDRAEQSLDLSIIFQPGGKLPTRAPLRAVRHRPGAAARRWPTASTRPSGSTPPATPPTSTSG